VMGLELGGRVHHVLQLWGPPVQRFKQQHRNTAIRKHFLNGYPYSSLQTGD
jgi:hypothetical protein